MSGSALELALALRQVPSMRLMLRERPLPEDMSQLLALAGGSPALLEEAAGIHGETPAAVLEAVRFYVQEVLLFPGADAYRVLGLQRSADAARIKAHYRALQRWLHPDRCASDLEAAYATRVNGAWAQLRNEERRRIYDLGLDDDASLPVADPDAAPVYVGGWKRQASQPARWKIIPPAAAILACLWLGWLISREPSLREPPRGRSASAPVAAAAKPTIDAPVPTPQAVAQTDAIDADPVPEPLPPVAQPDAETGMSVDVPAVAPVAVAKIDAATPKAMPKPAGSSNPLPARTSTVAKASPTPEAVTGTAIAQAPAPRQARRTAAVAGTTDSAPIAALPVMSEARIAAVPKPNVALPTPEAVPERLAASVRVPESDAAPEAADTAMVATSGPESDAEILYRMHAAERRIGDLWAYLSGQSAVPPPIWHDTATLDAANRLRQKLATPPDARRSNPVFSSGRWRVDRDRATVLAEISTEGYSWATVSAQLAWHGDRWWVRQVAWELAPESPSQEGEREQSL